MKTTLLGAVAIAALLAHSGVASAQPIIVDQPGRSLERQEERAKRAEERVQERQDKAQEKTQNSQERAKERAENAQERVQERSERERARANSQDKPETPRATSGDAERNRASQPQRNSQDAQPSTAPTPPTRRAAEQAKEQEKTSTTQQKSSTEQEKATTARDKPAAPSTASETETQKSGTAPAQRSTSNPAASNPAPTNPSAANSAPSGTQPNTGSAGNSFDPPQAGGTASGTAAAAPQQQRILDTVQQRIERREVEPETNLGVTATVGTTLPARVRLNPLPREIITIRPNYRDYRYVVSRDEVIIVDPRNRRVVEVIERRGGGRVGFVDERRFFEVIERRRDLRRWRNADLVVRVGVVLPASAPFYDVPVEIVERNPRWRGYQYVVVEDEVAIVEPRTRRVVQVIERDGARGGGTAQASAGAEITGTLGNLGDRDRRAIIDILMRNVNGDTLAGMRDLRGSTLPEELELQPLPREVIERNEDLREYRYVLIGDDALIVDPRNRRVIDVIE